MNIFYFNITYACNSNCVFCYSHNTDHSGRKYNEILYEDFVEYLKRNNVHHYDRVIINGGEPFLHSNIIEILKSLLEFGCEVLIYTNGRCLKEFDFSFMSDRFRFIIPVHGHRALHDYITQCKGCFDSMKEGMLHLAFYQCKVDIKVILNPLMVSSQIDFDRTLQSIDSLPFNNAVHITKMADTIISRKNNIPSVSNALASKYTRQIYEHFANTGKIIKIFDTCVKDIIVMDFEDREIPLKVHFKDAKTEWDFKLYTPDIGCRNQCPHQSKCQSAIGNYTVLEFNNKFYKGLE